MLVSEECPIHQNYKEAICKAGDTDTIVTGRIGGTPVRILRNKMAREYIKREKEGASAEELELYTLGSLRKAVVDGDVQNEMCIRDRTQGVLTGGASVYANQIFKQFKNNSSKDSDINIQNKNK